MARFVVREGWVVQAYRYALDPSPRQERALASHAGAARVAYNWAVTWVLASWAQRKAEESYSVSEDERTPWRGWSLPALRREWNQVKSDVAPWWAQNSEEAYSSGLAGAAAAFGNYAGYSVALNTAYAAAGLYSDEYRDLPITSYAWQNRQHHRRPERVVGSQRLAAGP
jgi:hypothetical protein